MPIKVSCKCGKRFLVKDELEGRSVKCPQCSQPLKISKEPPPAAAPQVTPVPDAAASDDLYATAEATPPAAVDARGPQDHLMGPGIARRVR